MIKHDKTYDKSMLLASLGQEYHQFDDASLDGRTEATGFRLFQRLPGDCRARRVRRVKAKSFAKAIGDQRNACAAGSHVTQPRKAMKNT